MDLSLALEITSILCGFIALVWFAGRASSDLKNYVEHALDHLAESLKGLQRALERHEENSERLVKDSLHEVARLQAETARILRDMNTFIVEADRRATKDHAHLLSATQIALDRSSGKKE